MKDLKEATGISLSPCSHKINDNMKKMYNKDQCKKSKIRCNSQLIKKAIIMLRKLKKCVKRSFLYFLKFTSRASYHFPLYRTVF